MLTLWIPQYATDQEPSLTAYSPLTHGALVDDEMLADIGSAYDKTAPQAVSGGSSSKSRLSLC